MNIVFHALGLLSIAFAIHWVLWRTVPPRRHTPALLVIFFGTVVGWLLITSTQLMGPPIKGWIQIQVTIFHSSLSLAYIVAYSAIEHRSPSMTLLVAVANAGSSGFSRNELQQLLTTSSPVEKRLEAMVRERLVYTSNLGYHLTPKGRFWARFFWQSRRLFGVPKGG
jgi:hypothetical protein